MTKKPNDRIMRAIHNIFNIREEITVNSSGDLYIKGTGIRIGYFDGDILFCENPVARALRNHDVEVKEGAVGWNEEVQYDLRIMFNEDGSTRDLSSNRMQAEVNFVKKKERFLSRLRCPNEFCKSDDVSVLETELGYDHKVKVTCGCANCENVWTEEFK